MAEGSKDPVQIIKPGILALGEGLPPTRLTAALFEDNTVSQISCGVDHSAVVLASGQVYVFGKNQDTGWMEGDENVISPPALVSSLKHVRVMLASCGNRFTMFLTDNGEVYSCGVNDRGQLGLGHKNKSYMPVLVMGLPPIKKLATGYSHTLVLTRTGQVWGAGSNISGQLGAKQGQEQTSFICVNDFPDVITDIACGAYFSAVVSATGVVLMTGGNDKGQLGLKSVENFRKFTQVSVPTAVITTVSCGTYHMVALRVDNSVWACGYNNCGQLGTKDNLQRLTPTHVTTLEENTITKVIAGQEHTALLTSEGNVLLFGKGTDGELGEGKENIVVPTLLKKSPELIVKQVAFAATYSLLLIGQKDAESPATQEQSEGMTPLKQKNACISEIEENIMKSLECPICFKIMSPPIHLCSNGHNVCATCRSNTPNCSLCRESYMNVKNLSLEHLSTVIPLPCVDCLERMPANLLDKHGEVCPYRKYDCPVQQLCGWSGRPEAMLAHMTASHPDQTWQNLPHLFVHSTSDERVVYTNILAAHGQVFTLHRRFDQNSGKFQTFVRYIGPPENVEHYKFKVTFIKDDDCDKSIFLKNVCVDTVNIDLLYESRSCVALNKDLVESYLYSTKLVCEVDVLKANKRNRNEDIKHLLNLK